MIRILYTVEERETTVFGGAARDLVWVLKNLDRSRFKPAVLLTGDDSFLTLLEQESVEDIEIVYLPLPPWRKFKYRLSVPLVIKKLEWIIRKGRFDIVHVNAGYNDVPYVTRAARRAGVVSIFTVRNSEIIGKKVKLYGYGKADGVIVCSKNHGELLEKWGVKSFPILSGVDENPVFNSIDRASLGIPWEAQIIGSVARLVPMKGYTFLFDAFAKLHAQFPDLWLIAVGGGDKKYQQELCDYVKRLSINDRVFFAGYQEVGRGWIPLFDIFVLSSIRGEATTIAVLEAMAEGKAVVATTVGGVPEIVLDGITGRLVPPQSAELLASAISELLLKQDKREQMGLAGRDRIVKFFSINAEVENLQNYYLKKIREKKNLWESL